MENQESFITLALNFGDEEIEVNLSREEYESIVWNAGRMNITINEYLNKAIEKEVENLKNEEE